MINIKEVQTKKDLRQFVDFPNKLYKDNKYYVPSLLKDEIDNFNPKKNPAYDFCETRLFLAYKDNKIVGRIAGLINHAYIKKVNKNIIRFTRFDVIDDIEVSKALIDKVKDWAMSRGIYTMMGPIGFTDIDKQGMLVEGFEEMDLSLTLYNHQYYYQHLEQLGFVKDADWVEFQITMPEQLDPRIERISQRVQQRYGFHRITVKKNKELVPYARQALKVIDESFAKLYGTVPLTEAIIEKAIKDYVPVVNLDYVLIIGNKEGEIIGFGLMVPSLAAALKKSQGRLFPLGMFRMIKALKQHKILEMYFIAVKPEYQKMGVNAVIMAEAVKAGANNGVAFAETGPELELNADVTEQWKAFPTRQHRRRRCYIHHFEKK